MSKLSRRSFLGTSATAAGALASPAAAQQAVQTPRRTQFDEQLLAGNDSSDPVLAANHGRQIIVQADGWPLTALVGSGKSPRVSVWRGRELVRAYTLEATPSAPLLLDSGMLMVSAGGSVLSANSLGGALTPIPGLRGSLLDAATGPRGVTILAVSEGGRLSLFGQDAGRSARRDIDSGAGRATMDFDPSGILHVAYEKKQGIEYRSYSLESMRELHAERVADAFGFHPVLLANGNRLVLAYLGESCRMPSAVKGSPAWERLGRGGYIAALVHQDGKWRRFRLAVSRQIAKPFAPIDSAYSGGVNRELRVGYEEFGPPALCTGPDGVVEVFWSNTVRRWIYSARLLGEDFSTPREERGPLEQLTGPCLVPRRVPLETSSVPIAILTKTRTYLDQLKRAGSGVKDGRRIDFVELDELAEMRSIEVRLNQMTRRPENPVIRIDATGVYDGAIVADIFPDGSGWRADLRYTTASKAEANGDQGKSYSGRGVSTDGIHWTKLEPLPLGVKYTVNGVTDHKYTIRYVEDPKAAAAHRFKGLSRSVDDEPWGWLAVTSHDGTNWTKVPDNSTIVRADDDLRVWIDPSDVEERRFKANSISRSYCGRVCVQWSSADGMRWNDERETLDFDAPFQAKPDRGSTGRILLDSWSGPDEEDEIHGGFVFRDGARWLLHYMKWTGDGHIYCGLASSRDGLNFSRVQGGASTLPLGMAGEWDAGRIALREAPYRVGNVWRQYYSGACWKHGLGGIGARTSHVGLNGPQQTGLAEIGVGHWRHLTLAADADSGEVTTIPLRLARAHELTVDLEGFSSDRVSFACSIVNPTTGSSYPGFGFAEFDTPVRDGHDLLCLWGGRSLSTLGAAAIQLRARISGRRGKLFGWNLV